MPKHIFIASIQKIIRLDLIHRGLCSDGIRSITDMLIVNQVSQVQNFSMLMQVIFHRRIQTLTSLNLSANNLGTEAAKYVADMLKINRVRSTIRPLIATRIFSANILRH